MAMSNRTHKGDEDVVFALVTTSKRILFRRVRNVNIANHENDRLKAVFQIRVLHTYVRARKSLNQCQCYI